MAPAPREFEHIGRYRILNRIGRGGMGSLYRAIDPTLDREVAIKVLHHGHDGAELRERFAREGRSAARLHHPNIVTIFDVGEQDGVAYIVMEYVQGQTLAEIIGRVVPLNLTAKLQILEDVCGGLAYAHEQGVVHRDVKPANVMVATSGVVKILDFGIALVAHAESGLTEAGTLFGTMNYLSPEMVAGQVVDHRADVFGVGCVLFEFLTGRKLYQGGIAEGLLARLTSGVHDRLTAIAPELPSALDEVLDRSVAREPEHRYQSLREMSRDLARCRTQLLESPEPFAMPTLSPIEPVFEPTMISIPVPFTEAQPPAAQPDATMFLVPNPVAGNPVGDVPDVRLLVSHSPDPHRTGSTIPISGGGILFGRGPDCDVNVNDPTWSRHHARIEWQNGGFVIHDLGSRNGTLLNGRVVRTDVPEPLFLGASIALGHTSLTFAYGHDTALPDLAGAEVAGRYRLERLLRESAKAAVYAARDRNVPREVAIKLLSPELARYAGYREQFDREARTSAELQHPHVCQVLDSGSAHLTTPGGRRLETCFICFELMAGGNLAARLETGPIDLGRARRWIEMLGSALSYAHGRQVIHGDLKPSAVVFDTADQLYLTDFAIAQRAAEQGQPMMGAPAFVAPEQWEGSPPTAATDQYAMAAVAYYMLTGSRPFEGQDNPEIRRKNLRHGAIAAHKEAVQNGREPFAPAVSQVLRRALSVDPAARFPSVEAFTGALVKALKQGVGSEPMVFVSYDRELSGGWARFFADRMRDKHGMRVFMDTTGIDRAGRFSPRLQQAIEECDVFVCFLASATLDSKWVREEVRMAHRFNKTMIPIFQESFVEPTNVEESAPVAALISHQGIKLFDISGHFVDHAVVDLVQLVKDATGGEEDNR